MNLDALNAVALSVRSLSMDAVQAANSGHPGLPMGVAELGALLYGEVMNHNPEDPNWINRDRFILSAGHGSMLLYSLLYLAGYDLSLEDVKNFRQFGHKTPGHPEYGHTPGVETTTGPLGQGLSNGVGMAIAAEMLAGKFNTSDHSIIDNYIYVLAGDGDMMEGITGEASSLAGHLGLGRLIVFYDSNKITIEGSTNLAFSEDVVKRYQAYGWQTMEGDAYDLPGIMNMIEKAKADTERPTFIKLTSLIGKGSPNKAGTAGVHGAALGEDELKATKKNLGLKEDEYFFVHPEAESYFKERRTAFSRKYEDWKKAFADWAEKNPELKKDWNAYFDTDADLVSEGDLPDFPIGEKLASRKASGKVLQAIAKKVANLVGGSADLAPSNNTALPDYGDFSLKHPTGRTLHFGVREHAMGAICNGIALYGGFHVFCATFLVFSDYMRPSIRLAALMKLPVTYIFTHDSIYVGEDGPTHQPVEHVSALRSIPNMLLLRPGDAEETALAWKMALDRKDGPAALALTRQGLPTYEKADPNWRQTAKKGAYVVKDTEGAPEIVLIASGSEVGLALEAAEKSSKKVRVVSLLSNELFLKQDKAFRSRIIPDAAHKIVCEVGVSFGLEHYASSLDDMLCLNSFGASGPGAVVGKHFGFSAENLLKMIGG